MNKNSTHTAIFGGGPTGITVALLLAESGHDVTLVEREKTLGGCWRVEWVDGLFTEHSPRVLSSSSPNFFAILKHIGIIVEDETVETYKNGRLGLISQLYNNLELSDMVKLFISLISNSVSRNELTVEEWLSQNNITEKGKKIIRVLTIALQTTSENTMMKDFLSIFWSIDTKFLQFKDHEKWITTVYNYLRSLPNVTIMTEYYLDSIHTNKDENINTQTVSDVSIKKTGSSDDDIGITLDANNYILAMPPIALLNVLERSDIDVKNNWKTFSWIKEWAEKSHYYSFGFQLHFDKKIKYKSDWCASCMGDWNIIMLEDSKYQTNGASKDKSIISVLSCTIVDGNAYSNHLGKTVHELDKDDVVNEAWRQIKEHTGINNEPIRTTVYDGVVKVDGNWTSKDTAFCRTKHGFLNQMGKLNNLFSVGPHNNRVDGVTRIEYAVRSGFELANELEPKSKKIVKIKNKTNGVMIILLISIITVAIIQMTK